MAQSIFSHVRDKVYDHQFHGLIEIESLVGGIPSDAKKAEGWLRANLGETREERIQALAAETMVERGISMDEAVDQVLAHEHLNGFKRDPDVGNQLYIEGRQMKSMIKECANIRWPKERWGISKKGTKSFFAEHVFVSENRLHIPATEPTGIHQRFVHTWRGSGIQYEEYVDNARLEFTIVTDHDFKTEQWEQLWITAEMNGLGSSRSQGYGRFAVLQFDEVK